MSERPVIEVIGPWLHNSGDALNLWAVARRLGPAADLAVSSTLGLNELPDEPKLLRLCWPVDRAAAGEAVRRRSPRRALRCAADSAIVAAPRGGGRLAQQRGVVAGRMASALVDCSGYAYGDPWGAGRVRARTEHYRRLKRAGARIILLPQAFGPFEDPEKRNACRRLLELADTIYPRDGESMDHLRALNLSVEVAGPVPDITHGLPGRPPADPDRWSRRVCIVPNARMLDRTGPEAGGRYFCFMVGAMRAVRRHGLEPVLLVHETNDLPLARRLTGADGAGAAIVHEDALAARGMLGAAHAVVGSRYHALISALSQGVPALATSWSHKYEQLLADYGCPERIASLDADAASAGDTLDRFLRSAADQGARRRLLDAAARQRARVETMWEQIEHMLPAGKPCPAAAPRLAPVEVGLS